MSAERLGPVYADPMARRRLSLHPYGAHANEAEARTALSAADAYQDAVARGYREGFGDGLKDAEAELRRLATEQTQSLEEAVRTQHAEATARVATMRAELQALMEAIPAAQERQRRWAEELALEIAMQVMSRMLGERAADQTAMAMLCHQLCAEATCEPIRLRVAPSDRAHLGDAFGTLSVIADARLTPGSAVLETHRGELHTSLEARLEALVAGLRLAFAAGDTEEAMCRP